MSETQAISVAAQPQPPRQLVAAHRTATHPVQFRAALERAHEDLTGKPAPAEMLDVLTAHVSHETASGDKMYNFNFGGIKGRSPEGLTARYKTTEVFGGKQTKIVDGFRAYDSLDDGAKDYLKFLQGRYGKAYSLAEQGDVDGFSRALKEKGYYTAGVDTYARAVRHHMANPGAYATTSMDAQAGVGGRYLYGTELAIEGMESNGMRSELPTAVEIARIMDAMSGLAARIGSPTGDPDENEGSW